MISVTVSPCESLSRCVPSPVRCSLALWWSIFCYLWHPSHSYGAEGSSGSTRDLLKKGQWEDSVRILLTKRSHLKSSLSGWKLPNFYPRLAFQKNRIVLVTPGKMFSRSIKMSDLTSICLFCLLLNIITLTHRLTFLSEPSRDPFSAVTSMHVTVTRFMPDTDTAHFAITDSLDIGVLKAVTRIMCVCWGRGGLPKIFLKTWYFEMICEIIEILCSLCLGLDYWTYCIYWWLSLYLERNTM